MFESIAKNNLEEKFKYIKGNYSSDIDRLVNIVGSVILEEIKGKEKSDFYPSPHELNDESKMEKWLPPTLLKLLQMIIQSPLKRTTVGHAVAAASPMHVHLPLLFGLGVQLDPHLWI